MRGVITLRYGDQEYLIKVKEMKEDDSGLNSCGRWCPTEEKEKSLNFKNSRRIEEAVLKEQTHADSRDKAVGILLKNDVQGMNSISSIGQSMIKWNRD